MGVDDLFCDIDDFCHLFLPDWQHQLLTNGERNRFRACRLALSEIMTILVYLHQSQYRNFKAYYLLHLCRYHRGECNFSKTWGKKLDLSLPLMAQ